LLQTKNVETVLADQEVLSLLAKARLLKVEYDLVQGEATWETLRRFRWVAAVLTPVFLFLSWWLSSFPVPADSPHLRAWATSLAQAQAGAALVSVLLAWVAHLTLRSNQRATAAGIVLHVLICASYLAYGALVTLIDLRFGAAAGVASYMMVTVLVGVLSLMRPAISAPMFLLTGLVFNFLMSGLDLNHAQLPSLRIIALSAPAMALLANIMIWHQYAKTVLLRRQLSRNNESLTAKQAELQYLAERDMLTGLYNRGQFTRIAIAELTRVDRYPAALSLLILDIDFFKKINDSYGHPAGDEVLRQVAALLKAGVRATDTVARLGGEEFIVLMPHTASEGAMAMAEKLRVAVCSHPLHIGELEVLVSASFGVIAVAEGVSTNLEVAYGAADRALYVAKQQGRNRVEFMVLA
jgi:diguanylate cyclase (GGDEF)-like protein